MWRSLICRSTPCIARAVLSNRRCCSSALHQSVFQITRLREVIGVVRTVVVAIGCPVKRQWRLAEVRLLLPFAVGVGLIVQPATVVTIYPHRAIAVITVHGAARRINRNLVMVDAQTVALRIAVRKDGLAACDPARN